MTRSAAPKTMIPTKSPQLPSGETGHPGTPPPGRSAKPRSPRAWVARSASSRVLTGGTVRETSRSGDRPVIELDFGITVYPARFDGDRWRAAWTEDGLCWSKLGYWCWPGFHAVCRYSLISPASRARRWIRASGTGQVMSSRSSSGAQAMPSPWWLRPVL